MEVETKVGRWLNAKGEMEHNGWLVGWLVGCFNRLFGFFFFLEVHRSLFSLVVIDAMCFL